MYTSLYSLDLRCQAPSFSTKSQLARPPINTKAPSRAFTIQYPIQTICECSVKWDNCAVVQPLNFDITSDQSKNLTKSQKSKGRRRSVTIRHCRRG